MTNAEIPNTQGSREKTDSTLLALFFLNMLKGADVQMLPSSFHAMEADLRVTPSQLAMMALCQGVACACTGPFWGNLVDSGVSRKWLLQVGAGLWGVCTILLGLSSDLVTMTMLRVLNGAALALIVPVVQSLVADVTDSTTVGTAFGKVACASNVGQVMACLLVTPCSELTVLGMRGWRTCLIIFGTLSILAIPLTRSMVYTAPRQWQPRKLGIIKELQTMSRFLRIPTFRVIVLQGIFGTIPGAAESFTTMYLQYLGVSNSLCGLILALRTVGDGLGSVLGGHLGDVAGDRTPNGRIFVAMFSVLMNIPMMVLIYLHGVGDEPNMHALLAGLLFFAGIISSWEVSGCINPVLIDIIPRRNLASAFAWNVGIVFTSGNMIGPLFVGFTAQHLFHYKLGTNLDDLSPEARQQNAEALGKSLCISCTVPAMISALVFSMLFCTYQDDKRRQADALEEESDVPELTKDSEETPLLEKQAPEQTASLDARN